MVLDQLKIGVSFQIKFRNVLKIKDAIGLKIHSVLLRRKSRFVMLMFIDYYHVSFICIFKLSEILFILQHKYQ